MHRFNLKDEEGRDASVAISSITHTRSFAMRAPEPLPSLTPPGRGSGGGKGGGKAIAAGEENEPERRLGEIAFRKYLQATERCLLGPLSEEYGDDLGQKILEGDPEIDIEQVGRTLEETNAVFLADSGEVLYSPPLVEEVRINPAGEVVNRREPVDHESNTQDETPVTAKNKRFTKLEFVQSYLVARTVQIRHTDGLSYDWLHKWAKKLADKGEVQMLAAGPKSNKPLRFQRNGTPHFAFLEGRVDDGKYKLLMHLSNMALKRDGKMFSNEFND